MKMNSSSAASLALLVIVAGLSMASALNVSFFCPSAIFSFADSLSDSGNLCLEATAQGTPGCVASELPYGRDLPDGLTGRFTNGRIMPDLLAEFLHISHLEEASLLYNKTTVFRGLNFGYGGATVMPSNGAFATKHIFPAQVEDFLDHKNQVLQRIPQPIADLWYSKALYFIQIGGNDVNFNLVFNNMNTTSLVDEIIPGVAQGMLSGIKTLYDSGAKNFLIVSTPAAGCLPFFLKFSESLVNSTYDDAGCSAEINYLSSTLNAAIKTMVDEILRPDIPDANIMYFDLYAATKGLVMDAQAFGFDQETVHQPCCGIGGGKYNCVGDVNLCGCNSTAIACDNADRFISWDGLHYTEHSYRVIVESMFLGKLEPPTTMIPGCGVPIF